MTTRHPPVAVLLASALVGALVAPPAGAGGTESADTALDQAIERFAGTRNGPPGIAVVVQRGDDVQLHAAGTADLATETPPALEDHTRLASVAKAFSGATAVALVSEGALSLDDTIGDRLPDLPEAWAEVTLAQLMNHTGGVPDFSKSRGFQEAVGESLTVPAPPDELLTYIADEPLEFEPGTRYQYSNSDNVIIALMAQAVTGEPYALVLQSRVYEPLGLTGTSLPEGPELPEPFIHGYDVAPPDPPEDVSELIAAGWSWASGGVVSTPADANRFVRGYVQGGTTDEATRSRQFRFRKGSSEPPGPGTNAAGHSVFRYRTRCGTVFGHTGNTPGYTQFIAASGDGTKSTSVSVNAQITPDRKPREFRTLRKIFGLAVCAAMAEG